MWISGGSVANVGGSCGFVEVPFVVRSGSARMLGFTGPDAGPPRVKGRRRMRVAIM